MKEQDTGEVDWLRAENVALLAEVETLTEHREAIAAQLSAECGEHLGTLAEVERLRAALEGLVAVTEPSVACRNDPSVSSREYCAAYSAARAALAATGPKGKE